MAPLRGSVVADGLLGYVLSPDHYPVVIHADALGVPRNSDEAAELLGVPSVRLWLAPNRTCVLDAEDRLVTLISPTQEEAASPSGVELLVRLAQELEEDGLSELDKNSLVPLAP